MNTARYTLTFKKGCLALAMLAYSTMASAITLSISPGSQTIGISDTVDIAVVISGLGDFMADSLGTYDLNISYDSTVLTFQSATFGDSTLGDQLDLFGLGSITADIPGSDVVEVYEVSLDSPSDLDSLQPGTFELVTLSFSANAVGVSSIDISVIDLGDANGYLLSASTINGGTITVSAVPIPAAVWLFYSGLLGLIGIAKRKKVA